MDDTYRFTLDLLDRRHSSVSRSFHHDENIATLRQDIHVTSRGILSSHDNFVCISNNRIHLLGEPTKELMFHYCRRLKLSGRFFYAYLAGEKTVLIVK